MTTLFKKLNFREQRFILALNVPKELQDELRAMEAFTKVITKPETAESIDFAMVFAERQAQVDGGIRSIGDKLRGDAVVWFCYPKGSSKNYRCDFNRDTGWALLGDYGMEPVRQVSVNEDWSALRFRKLEYIKQITRRDEMRLTGKNKSSEST